MQIGIFARTFVRPTLGGVLQAIRSHGLTAVHFNLKCLHLETLCESIDKASCHDIRSAFDDHGLKMVAISGTFNAIHPDSDYRDECIRRTRGLIEKARDLGTDVVSLCTGTRDPHNMWRRHRDNDRPEAWQDLLATLEKLLPAAETHEVTLGIEPERANVIDSATKARRLLDEIKSPRLKITIDGANLFEPNDLSGMQDVLAQAFDLLAGDTIMAHAKDITNDPRKKDQAAGTGVLDWQAYFRSMSESGFNGPVVLHNLDESQVDRSTAFVRRHAARWYPQLRAQGDTA